MVTFVEQAIDISRQDGFQESFRPRPLPSSRDEGWRLSQLKRLQQLELTDLARPFELEIFELSSGGEPRKLPGLPQGLTLTEASTFREVEAAADEFYEDIPRLFPRRGWAVKVAASYEGPDLLFQWSVSTSAPSGTVLAPLQISWEVEPGAQFRAARFISVPADTLAVVRDSFDVSAGAQLELASYTERQAGSISLESKQVQVGRDGRFSHVVLDLGESYSRQSLVCRLQGKGAECRLLGAVGLTAKDASEHPVIIDHQVSHTQSQQLFKSVLNGSSRAVLNGKVVIRQDAQKVDSSQYNKNLLLSGKALVHSKPELQVSADDVKAAHGATSGQVRPEEIFYLRSRGISEERALELISAGFLKEVVEDVSSAALKNWVLLALDKKLPEVLLEGAHGPS